MENNMTHAVCAECGAEFDYILKPGFPRKYCATCSEIKKQQYADKQPVPVVKPGLPSQNETFKKAPAQNGQLAMYVSYAKDIFCAIISSSIDRNIE